MDSILSNNFGEAANLVTQENWDWLHVNSGIERGGKSGFSLGQAWFLSHECGLSFDWSPELSHVFFIQKGITKQMMGLPTKSVAIIDEGGEIMFSRDAIDRAVKSVIKTLMVYGAKNIFLIINTPNWRWIDKYVRESRCRSLCEVKTIPKLRMVGGKASVSRQRGFYSLYNRKQIIRASKSDFQALGTPFHRGRFPNFATQHPEEWGWYSDKKKAFLVGRSVKEEEKQVQVNRAGVLKKAEDLSKLSRKDLEVLGGIDLGL